MKLFKNQWKDLYYRLFDIHKETKRLLDNTILENRLYEDVLGHYGVTIDTLTERKNFKTIKYYKFKKEGYEVLNGAILYKEKDD